MSYPHENRFDFGKVPDRKKATIPSRVIKDGPGRTSKPLSSVEDPRLRLQSAIKTSQNRYRYQAINTQVARLLIIESRQARPSELYVTLKTVALSELGQKFQYEALSYTWGDDHPNKRIFVTTDRSDMVSALTDGSRPSEQSTELYDVVSAVQHRQLWIKPNLYDALEHLRQDDSPTTMWVDALCINQDDRKEKQGQVANMNKIYSKAARVLVWLGNGSRQYDQAMEFIENVVKLENLTELVNNENRIDDWTNLVYLIRSPWFSRRWVIQELALARDATVHCGKKEQNWINFRDAISLLSQNFDTIRTHYKRSAKYDNDYNAEGEVESFGAKVLVDMINEIFRTDPSGETFKPMQSLEYLVSRLSNFDTSDPRDTIHALRNIAKETWADSPIMDSADLPPKPDYEQDLLTTYTEFVKWVVDSSGKLDIICRRWAIPERHTQVVDYPELVTLPSWIQLVFKRTSATHSQSVEAGNSRLHGESFVGLPGEGSYNASHNKQARVRFGDSNIIHPRTEAKNDSPRHPTLPRLNHLRSDTKSSTQLTKMPTQHGKRRNQCCRDMEPPDHGKDQLLVQPNHTVQLGASISDGFPTAPSTTDGPNVGAALSSRDPVLSTGAERDKLSNHSSHDRHEMCIRVDGIQIGEIKWATDEINDGVIPFKAIERLTGSSTGDNERTLAPDKLWRTLVAERGPDGRNPPPWYSRVCKYCQADEVRKFLKRVQEVTWNRKCFEAEGSDEGEGAGGDPRTQPRKGPLYHGLASERAAAGNIVCILFGCSVPVVLEKIKTEGSEESYYFCGEAYVYGMMDGEAISGLRRDVLEKRTKSFKIL
ncbi:hypothetical protein KC343_g2816 [Hortaea werneckii]|nr:hypothetical protein KC352_g13482 [Hortaea werneckii]KAI7569542.1 hypothetical protein KC317_g3238 [Hortaea werneckii]KAI7623623.1 hypothetical protein KC346_g2650 [Hortaea werneckii]KAI7633650.1 hypothetical protein KC343_g2816 [Hortaea werneckii]KAI7678997.1 hypothetical protein KC319_g3003 [Hortaea werneckii]